MNQQHVKIKDTPHYTISAAALADWLDAQPEKWWSVDGEPHLMSVVDFPCPSDELSPPLRKIGKSMLIHDFHPDAAARGEPIPTDQLYRLGDTRNRSKRPYYAMSWEDDDETWLLIEDRPLIG